MIHIEKGQAPAELAQAVREMRSTPDATVSYENLRKDAKDAVKESLVAEQHGLCAYCERRVRADGKSSIEHIVPQHGPDGVDRPAESLDYGNMLAVCRPGDGTRTCDRSRGNAPMRVSPLDKRTLAGIRYTRGGEIHSSDPVIDHDLCVTLNLNDAEAHLPQGRRRAWESVNKMVAKIAGKGAGRHAASECEKMREALLASDIYPEHAGLILARLDHFIGKFGRS